MHDQTKPWSAPARTLVLWQRDLRWRFAVHNEAGIIDGRFDELPPETTVQEAQSRLLANVTKSTGLEYVATWTENPPGWWSATLDTP